MNNKRMLILADIRWWNAEANYALNLGLCLQNNGWQPWIVASKQAPIIKRAKAKNLAIFELNRRTKNPLTTLSNYKQLYKLIQKEKIGWVNSFKSEDVISCLILKLCTGCRIVKTRGKAQKPRLSVLNRWIYQSVYAGLIAASDQTLNWLKEIAPRQKIARIYYCSEPLSASATSTRRQARLKLGYQEKEVVFSLIGRSQALKGHLDFITALYRLDRQAKGLLMIKSISEYPAEISKMQRLIDRLGLQNRVQIRGFSQNLADDLLAVDCAVIPSLASEINCRVLIEMFSAKIPCVAYPTGSLAEIITHRRNGLLCAQPKVDCLAKLMQEIVDSPQKRHELALCAYGDYQQNFTLQTLYRQMTTFLASI